MCVFPHKQLGRWRCCPVVGLMMDNATPRELEKEDIPRFIRSDYAVWCYVYISFLQSSRIDCSAQSNFHDFWPLVATVCAFRVAIAPRNLHNNKMITFISGKNTTTMRRTLIWVLLGQSLSTTNQSVDVIWIGGTTLLSDHLRHSIHFTLPFHILHSSQCTLLRIPRGVCSEGCNQMWNTTTTVVYSVSPRVWAPRRRVKRRKGVFWSQRVLSEWRILFAYSL